MSRPPSTHVEAVREKLRTRLRAGVHRPGDRFLSARELRRRSAYRIKRRIEYSMRSVAEGLLERRAASGTYIPGGLVDLQGAQLIFNPRARHEQSFGGRLLADLTARLERDRVSWKLAWTDKNYKFRARVCPFYGKRRLQRASAARQRLLRCC
jgi:DNA-binding transcriptional MocR family regulator